MWKALSKLAKAVVILAALLVVGAFVLLGTRSCDNEEKADKALNAAVQAKNIAAGKASPDGLVTSKELGELKKALATKADAARVIKALDTKADAASVSSDLNGKADKDTVTTAQETADKALEVACRNHPKDPKCVKAPEPDPNADPMTEPEPPAPAKPATKPEPVKPTPKKWRAGKWTKPIRPAAAPTTDPALERRVSNLETRMARQEYLTTPLSEYADKHKEKYLERARARLEALDRLPATNDKVQGESK